VRKVEIHREVIQRTREVWEKFSTKQREKADDSVCACVCVCCVCVCVCVCCVCVCCVCVLCVCVCCVCVCCVCAVSVCCVCAVCVCVLCVCVLCVCCVCCVSVCCVCAVCVCVLCVCVCVVCVCVCAVCVLCVCVCCVCVCCVCVCAVCVCVLYSLKYGANSVKTIFAIASFLNPQLQIPECFNHPYHYITPVVHAALGARPGRGVFVVEAVPSELLSVREGHARGGESGREHSPARDCAHMHRHGEGSHHDQYGTALYTHCRKCYFWLCCVL